MDVDVVHDIAREYVHLKPQTRCAVLFPASSAAHKEFLKTLQKYFEIDFKISVLLSFSGIVHLQTLLYGNHDWWSYKNAYEFAKIRYNGSQFITLAFFQETKETRPVKEEMRKYHSLDNHALHTTGHT